MQQKQARGLAGHDHPDPWGPLWAAEATEAGIVIIREGDDDGETSVAITHKRSLAMKKQASKGWKGAWAN